MRIKLKDGTVIEQEGVMEIDTALGTLYVELAGDSGLYPGFYINLRRPDGNEFCPMLVEVDQSDWGDPPAMKMHYWSPESHWDEPVWNEVLTAEDIDSTFREEE